MNRMGIPQPDYTPDGVLAEIARVVPFFKGAVWEKLGDNGKQWPIQEGTIKPALIALPQTMKPALQDRQVCAIKSE